MKTARRLIVFCMVAVMLLLTGCGSGVTVIDNPKYFAEYLEPYDTTLPIKFEIVFESGEIVSGEMEYANAPITVGNFVKLCTEGFYDGLTIHRTVADKLIQGGDETGTGTGRQDYAIRGEFADNGWNNQLQHLRGTISMARRANDFNSADTQFFITIAKSYSYDPEFAAFGTITSGMPYIEKLSRLDDGTGVPTEPIVIETIRILGN